MTTTVIYNEAAQPVKERKLRSVPTVAKVEHAAICAVDGEPWPCRHTVRQANFRMSQYYAVFCLGCGKPRNAWHSLSIERDLNGQAVYFHARKRCGQKAVEWWNENVKPHTGKDLLFRRDAALGISFGSESIDDLTRHLAIHNKLKVAEQA